MPRSYRLGLTVMGATNFWRTIVNVSNAGLALMMVTCLSTFPDAFTSFANSPTGLLQRAPTMISRKSIVGPKST
jgi:hypothetical protein